jgi:hypothetical protein
MIFHARLGRVPGRTSVFSLLAGIGALMVAVNAAASPSSEEVSFEYKAKRGGTAELSSYEEELLECSALAGIHTWIGDNLGDDSGAEIRKSLNNDYWINVSKSYLALAQQATGKSDLFPEVGNRMKALAAEYRDLTASQADTSGWLDWYQLIDRCDTWRPNPPAHAFYNNGRQSMAIERQTPEVAMGSNWRP